MTAHLLVIDDHPLIRNALRTTLESISPNAQVHLAASYGEASRLLAGGLFCDAILLDLNLPDRSGFDALATLCDKYPDKPIVVLSAENDRAKILRCLALGARGYIPKTYHADAIRHAMQLVLSGETHIPRGAVDPRHDVKEPMRPFPAGGGLHQLGLTERQYDVFRLMLLGLPNKLICRQLNLAEGTVKVHVSAVLRALGVRNRTQVVVAASQLGIRTPD